MRDIRALDSRAASRMLLGSLSTMGQQLNKVIKRKRRAAYLKRRKARAKTAAAAAKKK